MKIDNKYLEERVKALGSDINIVQGQIQEIDKKRLDTVHQQHRFDPGLNEGNFPELNQNGALISFQPQLHPFTSQTGALQV